MRWSGSISGDTTIKSGVDANSDLEVLFLASFRVGFCCVVDLSIFKGKRICYFQFLMPFLSGPMKQCRHFPIPKLVCSHALIVLRHQHSGLRMINAETTEEERPIKTRGARHTKGDQLPTVCAIVSSTGWSMESIRCGGCSEECYLYPVAICTKHLVRQPIGLQGLCLFDPKSRPLVAWVIAPFLVFDVSTKQRGCYVHRIPPRTRQLWCSGLCRQ